MTTQANSRARAGAIDAHVGDRLEAHSIHGGRPRCGSVVRVLGRGTRQRYLVRWDEQHESIVYPADGVRLVARRRGH